MIAPRIVVTLDTGTATRRGVPVPMVRLKEAYVRAVERAGGLPILAAPTASAATLEGLVGLMDGLVVTGGHFDIEPERYGGRPSDGVRVDAPKPTRTDFEAALVRAALARGRPVLGVCGGMQLLNVVLGGTLLADIRAADPEALDHEQPTPASEPAHDVELVPGTALARLLGVARIPVNSTHHQAPAELGRGLVVEGRSPDGVIEAIALRDRPSVRGVQWHPEQLDHPASHAIYRALVEACRASW